jgi:superfamily II DNA or RNA helicase
MGFPSLQIKKVYDTSTDDFVEDFFSPILSVAKNYDRGVGYFSSGWLKMNSRGMNTFAENGGHARWVTSPILSKSDWDTMCLGTEARKNELLFSLLSAAVTDLQESLETNVLSALAWLIADNIIEFKLAVPRNQLTGEFHDKFGIFTDLTGNQISFSGSYNDSIQGLRNYESITTFFSWDENSSDVVDLEFARFNRLWSNQDPNVRVFNLPDSIKQDIVKLRESQRNYVTNNQHKDDVDIQFTARKPHIPESIKIREYQNDAVKAWFDNGNQGFFEMATGTGKTITSLIASVVVFKKEERLFLIITAPYKHLVDQWCRDLDKFGFRPITAYESYDSWGDKLANKLLAYNNNDISNVCVVTTNTTFMTDRFASQISGIVGPSMIISDEAHHFGTDQSMKYLPRQIKNRLALSATPDRWFDETGTNALHDYFGDTVFSFPLQRAIEEGFLAPYYYYPITVDLSDEEMENYSILTKKIGQLLTKKKRNESDEDRLLKLLLKRSEILKDAEGKIEKLNELIPNLGNIHHSLFYCSHNQRQTLLRTLGFEHKLRVHEFTYRENNSLRKEILDQFDRGFIQAIVAIKCLDEGVDVPSSQSAFFLANSTNPREFVQRRGRVLRKAEGKTNAQLFDFLTIPPFSEYPEDMELTRSILRRELSRFEEFAKSSMNPHSAYDVIWDIAKKFNVLDF